MTVPILSDANYAVRVQSTSVPLAALETMLHKILRETQRLKRGDFSEESVQRVQGDTTRLAELQGHAPQSSVSPWAIQKLWGSPVAKNGHLYHEQGVEKIERRPGPNLVALAGRNQSSYASEYVGTTMRHGGSEMLKVSGVDMRVVITPEMSTETQRRLLILINNGEHGDLSLVADGVTQYWEEVRLKREAEARSRTSFR